MSEQTQLIDFPSSSLTKEQDQGEPGDKKDDPKEETDPSNEIKAYGEAYKTNKSKKQLKRDIMNYIENNKPVYYDKILDEFNTNDFVLLEVMGELHQEDELHGYREDGESLITIKEARKDGHGIPVKNKPTEDVTGKESRLKEPEPQEKPKTTRDKDPRDLSFSRDEERLISIIRGLLEKKGTTWVSWHDVYKNIPKNWGSLRLDETLVQLIRSGALDVKGVASQNFSINVKRLKEIRDSTPSSLSFNSNRG